MTRPSRAAATAWAVSLAVALLVLGPALFLPGSTLRGDMVFVPHQPWKAAWLGLDGGVPRAVPMDALVSAATYVIPGGWLQKLILLGSFVVAGVGIGRLAERTVGASAWGVAAATTAYLWNPWVVERLSIGQWATVAGYALLPWVVLAAWRLRDDPRQWPGLLLFLGLSAVCSPSNGLTAVLVSACVVLWATRRSMGRLAGCALAANAPWLVPSLTLGDQVDLAGDSGFAAFHATAESGLGLVVSAMSLGGIWKTSVVPAERTTVLVVGVAFLLSVISLVGLGRSRSDTRLRNVLLLVAFLSLALCVVPAWFPDQFDGVAEVIPGLSILRDSHRYLAPLSLALSVGLAHIVTRLFVASRGREGLAVVATALVAAPVLLLPSAVWGLTGDLRPAEFPQEWQTVADHLEQTPGTTIVLPWSGSYRRLGWNGNQASLDPAPRLLPGEVLIDDRIVLPGRTLPGEDPRNLAVTTALAEEDPAVALRGAGVRWVVVEKPLPPDQGTPAGMVVHDGTWLTLVDLGTTGAPVGAPAGDHESGWRRALIVGTDVVVVLGFFVMFGLNRRRGGYAPHRYVTGE